MKNKIADILKKLDEVVSNFSIESLENDGLFIGKTGLILYNYYLLKYTQEQKYAIKILEIIEHIFNKINADETWLSKNSSLTEGITGFALVINHLVEEEFLDTDIDQQLQLIDESLYIATKTLLEQKALDYFNGAFGPIHYFSKRLKNPRVIGYLTELVDLFFKDILKDTGGTYFINNEGYLDIPGVDLSFAHGLSGIYSILIRMYSSGYPDERIKRIVIGGADYILNFNENYNRRINNSLFPHFINLNEPDDQLKLHYSYRLAWCHGDLNVALLAYLISDVFQCEKYRQIGKEIGLSCIHRRDFETTRVNDSHLCHGSSGLTQVYKRLFELSGEEAFYESYIFWLKATITFLETEIHEFETRKNKESLIMGLPGAALPLLSFLLPKEKMAWDSVLLLS